MSDTPRTNKEAMIYFAGTERELDEHEDVLLNLARQLERELGQARKLAERLIDSIENEYGSDHDTFTSYRDNYEQLFNVKYEIKDY